MIDHTKKLVQERFTTANSYSYDAEVGHWKNLKEISPVVLSLLKDTRAYYFSLSRNPI